MKPTGILGGVLIAPERPNTLVTAFGEGTSEASLFRLAPSISAWMLNGAHTTNRDDAAESGDGDRDLPEPDEQICGFDLGPRRPTDRALNCDRQR